MPLKEQIQIRIADNPPGKTYVILSPWEGWFHTSTNDYNHGYARQLQVVEHGSPQLLDSKLGIRLLLDNLLAQQPAGKKSSIEAQREQLLSDIAGEFGLEAKDIFEAIKTYGRRTEDLLEKGKAALFEQRYADASNILEKEVENRRIEAEDFAEASFLLGQSKFGEVKYTEALKAFEQSAAIRSEDSDVA